MKNRKHILTTLVITTALLAPTVNSVFADTIQASTNQGESQHINTPKQRMEEALKLANFDDENVLELDEAATARYFGDKTILGKEITINNQKFNMVVLDVDRAEYNQDIGNGKTVIDIIKESEKTYNINLGIDMAAYYKDGVFIFAPTPDKSVLESNIEIIKNVFVNILDGKHIGEGQEESPAQTTNTETATETTNSEVKKETTNDNLATSPKDLVDKVLKNTLLSDITDITDKDELNRYYMSYAKYFVIDGVKFAIGVVDTVTTSESVLPYIYKSANTHEIFGDAAYYANGVFVRVAEKQYETAKDRVNGIVRPLYEKASTVLPQIIDIINQSSSPDIKDPNQDQIQNLEGSDSEDVGFANASMGFDDASGGFGDDSFGGDSFSIDNPQTFDSSISSYIGAIGASIVGMLTSMGIRKRK